MLVTRLRTKKVGILCNVSALGLQILYLKSLSFLFSRSSHRNADLLCPKLTSTDLPEKHAIGTARSNSLWDPTNSKHACRINPTILLFFPTEAEKFYFTAKRGNSSQALRGWSGNRIFSFSEGRGEKRRGRKRRIKLRLGIGLDMFPSCLW